MDKFVKVTWKTSSGSEKVEINRLVSKDDPIYLADGSGRTINNDSLFLPGWIVLEDISGIWCLDKKDLVKMEDSTEEEYKKFWASRN